MERPTLVNLNSVNEDNTIINVNLRQYLTETYGIACPQRGGRRTRRHCGGTGSKGTIEKKTTNDFISEVVCAKPEANDNESPLADLIKDPQKLYVLFSFLSTSEIIDLTARLKPVSSHVNKAVGSASDAILEKYSKSILANVVANVMNNLKTFLDAQIKHSIAIRSLNTNDSDFKDKLANLVVTVNMLIDGQFTLVWTLKDCSAKNYTFQTGTWLMQKERVENKRAVVYYSSDENSVIFQGQQVDIRKIEGDLSKAHEAEADNSTIMERFHQKAWINDFKLNELESLFPKSQGYWTLVMYVVNDTVRKTLEEKLPPPEEAPKGRGGKRVAHTYTPTQLTYTSKDGVRRKVYVKGKRYYVKRKVENTFVYTLVRGKQFNNS